MKQQGASRFILPPTPRLSLLPPRGDALTPHPQCIPLCCPQEQQQHLYSRPWPRALFALLGRAPQLPAATDISSLPRSKGLCPGERLPGSEHVQGSVLLPAPPKVSHLSMHRATRE